MSQIILALECSIPVVRALTLCGSLLLSLSALVSPQLLDHFRLGNEQGNLQGLLPLRDCCDSEFRAMPGLHCQGAINLLETILPFNNAAVGTHPAQLPPI